VAPEHQIHQPNAQTPNHALAPISSQKPGRTPVSDISVDGSSPARLVEVEVGGVDTQQYGTTSHGGASSVHA
jgi:hypothetical protein